MTNPKLRRAEDWQHHDRYDAAAAEPRERDYPSGRHHEPSAANYPQYLAENRHIRRGNQEHYDQSRHPMDRGENDAHEYRYGDQPRFSPLRFGSYDEVRNDSFGYTEVERQPHSFSPYLQGGRTGQQLHPGYYDPAYSNVGMNWSGPGYLHSPEQFRQHAQHEHPRHPDPDYHQWRSEQIRQLDDDYDQWRRERYQKFSEDFNNWRSTRPNQKHGPLPVEEPVGTGGDSKAEAHAPGSALPATGHKR